VSSRQHVRWFELLPRNFTDVVLSPIRNDGRRTESPGPCCVRKAKLLWREFVFPEKPIADLTSSARSPERPQRIDATNLFLNLLTLSHTM